MTESKCPICFTDKQYGNIATCKTWNPPFIDENGQTHKHDLTKNYHHWICSNNHSGETIISGEDCKIKGCEYKQMVEEKLKIQYNLENMIN